MSFPGEEFYPGEETLLFYTKIKHGFPLQAGLSLHSFLEQISNDCISPVSLL